MAAHLDISKLQISENPVQQLEDGLRICLDKLKEENFESDVGNSPNTNILNTGTTYWNTLGNCIDGVSKECTKISLAFSKPPFPSIQDSKSLVNGLEVVMTAVFATYKAFNKLEEGLLLHTVLKIYITDLTEALLEFVSSIKCEKKDKILKTIGIVWESCEAFASLPKDIKTVALKESHSCFELINDAITEAEEYYQEWNQCQVAQDEKESSVSTLTGQHITASIGLAKVSKFLVKKVSKCLSKNAQIDDVSKVKELDSFTQSIKFLSPSVDDLFCGIYSESLTEICNEGLELSNLIEKLLQLCRSSHFCLDEDGTWLDFLSKALDHNLNKLTSTELSA